MEGTNSAMHERKSTVSFEPTTPSTVELSPGPNVDDVESGAPHEIKVKQLEDDDENPAVESRPQSLCSRLLNIYLANQFVFHVVIAISFARAYPPLGAVYVHPDVSSKVAVALIFVLAGLGLRTAELAKAVTRVRINCMALILDFFAVSATVYGVTRVLLELGIVNTILADGMVICSCLPISINTAIVLTTAAGGDEAGAIFNTITANVTGIFLSPVLIVLFLGKSGSVDLLHVFMKLILQVIIPLIVGQAFQLASKKVRDVCKNYKVLMKKMQESCLVFIILTIFSKRFKNKSGDSGVGIGSVLLMVFYQLCLMLSFKGVFWILFRKAFPDDPEGVVMGLYCSMSKTIALGVPLISSMFEKDPHLALYVLPVLVWHPMQAVVGSMFVPYFSKFIQSERARLDVGTTEHDGDRDDSSDSASVEDEEAGATPVPTAELSSTDK